MLVHLQNPPMAASTTSSVFLLLPSLSSCTHKSPQLAHSLCFSRCFPFSAYKFNHSSITASRFWFCFRASFSGPERLAPRLSRRTCCVRCSVGDNSFTSLESESNSSEEGASVDLNLPRRSLLVHFTCNLCGERTKRLVNRLAYERGAIFVQCAGCLRHHKLVDNLGIITEYDFREKMSVDLEIDQV